MYFLSDSNPVEAVLHAGSFRRMLPLRSAPRGWAQGPTIAISREVGALGATVARAVGARLGWRVYDHEILDCMAQEMKVGVAALDAVDERGGSWLQECLESLGGEHRLNACSYTQHLVHVLFTLARPGNCVIVGRGAAQVLPGMTTMRVRLVAGLKDRILRVAQDLGLSPTMARRYLERKDQERIRFVKERFRCDPADPLQYDLILNSSRFSVDQCAELIVGAFPVWHRQTEDTDSAARQPQATAAST